MRLLSLARLAMALLLAACTAGGTRATSGQPADEAWRSASLTDVLTAEIFRVDDFRGKIVAIETMAIWCSTCRIQQGEAQAAIRQVDPVDVVYISLDVDPNVRAADLAAYARREGFTWRFAVASGELSRSLAATFGDQILSPPATAVVILGRDGAVLETHFGIKRAADLVAVFRAQPR